MGKHVTQHGQDLEAQQEGMNEEALKEPSWLWHLEQTLKFATLTSAAFAAYHFASFSASLFAGHPPRKEEMAAPEEIGAPIVTATAPEQRRAGPPPICPNTTLWGQQQYTGVGYQTTPVASSSGGVASIAFLNTPGAVARVSLGTASLSNPNFNLNVLPYPMDQLLFNKRSPGAVNTGNQTMIVFDNGFNGYMQTPDNAQKGITETYLSSDTFTSYRPVIASNGNVTAASFSTQECTIGPLQIARRKFANNGTGITHDVCVSTRFSNINDYSRLSVSQNTTMYAWTSQVNSTASKLIYFRDENATGFVQPSEVLLTVPQYFPHHDCIIQQLAWLNDGSRIALLTAKDQTNPTLGYVPYIQRISANGTLNGAPIQIPSTKQNYYYERMGVTVVSDGFVIAGGNDASGAGVIYFQKYNNLGQPQGSPITLPQLGSFNPTITTLPGDCLLVAYEDPNNHVSTQIFCPSLNLESTAQSTVSYTENGNAINLPPFYIPQVYTYTPGQIVINITFPANAGTITAGGQSSSSGSLQIIASSFVEANQILNCISYTQADNFANSFDVTVSVSDGISPPSSVTQPVTGIPINVPAVVNSASFVIPQGATVTITQSMLNITDVDTPAQNITIFISNPNNGYFQRIGVNGTVTPNVLQFTYDEVLAGKIQIVAQGTTEISFEMSVGDSRVGLPSNVNSITPNIYFIANQPETLLVSKTITVDQEKSTLITNSTLLAASNKNPAQVLFHIATIAHAEVQRFNVSSNAWSAVTDFTQEEINNGWIRIQSDNSGQTPVVVYTYGDSLWSSPLQTLTFDFNAAPVFRVAQINIDSAKAYQINQNNFLATDSTATPDQLTFSISKDSQLNGFFAYKTNLKSPIYKFTQADINAGSVYFVPNKNAGTQTIEAMISVSDGTLSAQKSLQITFAIPKQTVVQSAQQVMSNPGMGTLIGFIGTYLGYKGKKTIEKHRRDIVSTFAERVRTELDLNLIKFIDDNGQKVAFVRFIDRLIAAVDEKMKENHGLKSAGFRVQQGTEKHEWNSLKKAANYSEAQAAETDLNELAANFAVYLNQHAAEGKGLCLPGSVYTWGFGYAFKLDEATDNISNLAARIAKDLIEGKKPEGTVDRFKRQASTLLGYNASIGSPRGGRGQGGNAQTEIQMHGLQA